MLLGLPGFAIESIEWLFKGSVVFPGNAGAQFGFHELDGAADYGFHSFGGVVEGGEEAG